MLLPLTLIFFAILSAAAATYGMWPQWAVYEHGMATIEMARRLQWPLLTVTIVLCLVLLVLVITGKRRVWWLIGLLPVVALLLQLFVTGTLSNMQVVEQPAVLAASGATLLQDNDYVVGVIFAEKAYALPYRQLFNSPVVILTEREKRAVVLWSPYANCAMAFNANRQFKTRELSIVSMPLNALLVYNSRVGEFVNGVTGLTSKGQRPTGLGARIPAITTTWQSWRTMHPQTLVTQMPTLSTALSVPVAPNFPMKLATTRPVDEQIVFFRTSPPAALFEREIGTTPLNIEVGGVPMVIYREPITGRVKGFERTVAGQVLRFISNPSERRRDKGVVLLDTATNSGWTAAGVAVDGEDEMIGQRLTPVTSFDEGLYLGVMQNWYPEMVVVE